MAADKLKGKVAVVTGASSGIGSAIAEALAQEGAKVAMLARRVDRLESLKQAITSKGGEAVAVKCDVVNREEVFKAMETVKQTLGEIDILVNNAGILNATMMKNCRVDDWLQMVDVNIVGTLHCYAATLQGMIDKKSGHIINISSNGGRQGYPSSAVYAASKFFMQGHSLGIRQELAGLGIKVTAIQPGPTKTDLFQPSADEDATKFWIEDPTYNKVFTEPLMESEDVAKAVIFALDQEDRVGVNEVLLEPKTVIFNAS